MDQGMTYESAASAARIIGSQLGVQAFSIQKISEVGFPYRFLAKKAPSGAFLSSEITYMTTTAEFIKNAWKGETLEAMKKFHSHSIKKAAHLKPIGK